MELQVLSGFTNDVLDDVLRFFLNVFDALGDDLGVLAAAGVRPLISAALRKSAGVKVSFSVMMVKATLWSGEK